MTKIKFMAILIATLISGTTHSLSAQSSTRPTPIEADALIGELENQVNASENVIPEPIESNLTGEEFENLLSEQPPEVAGNLEAGQEYYDQGSGSGSGSGSGQGLLGSFFASPGGANRVWGISGAWMSRARFNDGVQFSNNVSSGDVTQDFGGLDLTITTRNQGGRGWEFRYFGLFEDNASIEPITTFGTTESLTRSSDLHNFELNFLRQRRSRILWTNFDTHESILGIRYFRFNEALDFRSDSLLAGPSQLRTEVENSLFGIQAGRRLEKRLVGKLGVFGSLKFGVFSNRARNNNFSTSPTAFAAAREAKTDIAFVGELDLGATYTFNQSLRAKLGYRALGATGVGLADGQFNQDLTTRVDVNTAGDVYLRGGYFGLELVY